MKYPLYEGLSEENKKKIEDLLGVLEEYKPWEECPDMWKTESSFFSWMRGALRSIWSRKWAPKNNYLKTHSFLLPVKDENGNQKCYKTGKKRGQPVERKHFKCEITGDVLPMAQAEIDHHPVPAGSCRSGLEVCVFLFKLLTTSSNMRIISKEAHGIVTHMERTGLSWEEAAIDKHIIEAMKKSVSAQKVELSKKGFSEKEISNKELRKECYFKLFNNEIKK